MWGVVGSVLIAIAMLTVILVKRGGDEPAKIKTVEYSEYAILKDYDHER